MSIVPIASDDTDGISSVTTDANYDIGISRIGNTIEIMPAMLKQGYEGMYI